ncbi:MAG: NADH-quinone oxidoreductase subunit L [Solirubrobacterales bacterium]
MTTAAWAWLVLLFPLLGSMVIAFGFRKLPDRTAGIIGSTAIGLAFIAGIGTLLGLLSEPSESRHVASSLWEYAGVGDLRVDLGIFVDPLAVFMVLVVTGVSFLIHVYSTAYMESDQGYSRFFSYLNFFVFSMLLLVLAGNFVLLIVGWAFVGFASYALISFWYRRTTATAAGMKAFVINVVGDIGLVLAAILIFRELGVLDYEAVFDAAPKVFSTDQWTIVAICLLLLVGAFAKSAQLPFHTWLADAMEGPTPVSSLIHAATMVTAGVYLVARTWPLFELAPAAANVAAIVGVVTLLVAGTIALVVTDLKRIIAYSTMSQIGYMFLAVGIGAYSAGMFHLMTHAFFKALLFMAAGSIIAAMANNQNIDRMRGLGKALPFTAAMLVIGSLALSGFPFTSGWFSKDEILDFALYRGSWYTILAIAGYVGAFMTALYAFRIVFRILPGKPCPEAEELIETGHVAHGEPVNPANGQPEDYEVGYPGKEHHIAEQSPGMRFGMLPLGVLALIAGFLQVPGVTEVVTKFLEPTFEGSTLAAIHPPVSMAWLGLLNGGVIAVVGIAFAWVFWVRRPAIPGTLRQRVRPLYELFVHKWYFDELIHAVIVRPVLAFGDFCNRVVEPFVVGGIVTGTTSLVRSAGALVRDLQSGMIRAYASLMVLGAIAVVLFLLLRGA